MDQGKIKDRADQCADCQNKVHLVIQAWVETTAESSERSLQLSEEPPGSQHAVKGQ